jgi:hypothetical protein
LPSEFIMELRNNLIFERMLSITIVKNHLENGYSICFVKMEI